MAIKLKCFECKNKREVAGNAHIKCINPDNEMTGNAHGIKKGWFYYPILFDPIWGDKECCNFESSVSLPVSPAVSE